MEPRPTKKELGQRLRKAREEASLRPERVADFGGMAVSTLTRYEKGDGEPSYLQVARIAELTGKPIGWFAAEESQDTLEADGQSVAPDLDRTLLSEVDRHISEVRRLLHLLSP